MTKVYILRRNIQKLSLIRKYGTNSQNLWSQDRVINSPLKDLEFPSLTVNDYIWQNVEKWADKPAMVCGITDRSYTYHQLYKYSRKFAVKLRINLNVREGDMACIMMSNNPEYGVIALGILEAGATLTTINPAYTAHEIHRQLLQSIPKVLIVVPETVGVIKEALNMLKIDVPLIIVNNNGGNIPEGAISFQDIINDDNVDYSVLSSVKKDIDEIALLPYSSGTTGLPKGVELVHRSIVTNFVQQDDEAIRHCHHTTGSHQESLIAILPFFHMYGLSVVMLHKLSVGAKIVTLPKFETKTYLNTMKKHRSSVLHIAPPLASFLGSHESADKEHLSSVHTYVCAAAPLPRQDIIRVLEKSKPDVDFIQLYGLTEVSPLATSLLAGSKNFTTVGYAVANTKLRIVNSNDVNLGPDEVGELLIHGPQVMKGYRNNSKETNDVITKDGWFRTGDLASIDSDGVVTIRDRIKELIKVKGFQVAPAELESVLKEHPDILDAAVIGVPNAKMGEVPKAFVVIKDGRSKDSAGIKKFVDDKVAVFKRLSDVQFVDSLPRNPSGKILRRILREKYTQHCVK